MARVIIRKIDRLINFIAISLIIGGGLIIHILTALTINSYYGTNWGYLSFLLPGLAEIYLVAIQISEDMYNYSMILAGFISLTAALGLVRYLNNLVRTRVAQTAEG